MVTAILTSILSSPLMMRLTALKMGRSKPHLRANSTATFAVGTPSTVICFVMSSIFSPLIAHNGKQYSQRLGKEVRWNKAAHTYLLRRIPNVRFLDKSPNAVSIKSE